MKQNTIKNLLSFFIDIEKLKIVVRHSWTSNSDRQESNAEHSWMMAMIAMTLFESLPKDIDQLKVLKMITLHDLAEVITTDIPSWEISERKRNKHALEEKALLQLTKPLPEKIAHEFLLLWQEFEEKRTLEAKLAQAIDKMEAVIQHNIADLSTWDQNDFDVHPFYKSELFDFDKFIRKLRDEVEIVSLKKIIQSKNMHRVKPELAKKWERLRKKAL